MANRAAPVRELEPLCKWADGTAVNVYYHRDKVATVLDVCKPGFFNFMRDTFRSGAGQGVVHYVICVLGDAAAGFKEVRLILDKAPLPSGGDVTMQKGPVFDYTCSTFWHQVKKYCLSRG